MALFSSYLVNSNVYGKTILVENWRVRLILLRLSGQFIFSFKLETEILFSRKKTLTSPTLKLNGYIYPYVLAVRE